MGRVALLELGSLGATPAPSGKWPAGAPAIVAILVLVGCATTTTPTAEPTCTSPVPQEMMELTGRVTAIGSDPFVLLVIVTDAEEEYELVGGSAEALWDVQQQRVTVRGRVVRHARGPGFPAQFEVDSYRAGAGAAITLSCTKPATLRAYRGVLGGTRSYEGNLSLLQI